MTHKGQEAAHGLDTPTWSQDMKIFKATVRWIASHCVSKDDEWRLQTSYIRQNRLIGLGITNKHAAIRGLPKLSDEQAKAIAKNILKTKGLLKKQKDQDDWIKNKLFAIPKPFYPKGSLQTIAKEDLLPEMQLAIDESIPAILDREMVWKERFPRLCRLECIYIAPSAKML